MSNKNGTFVVTFVWYIMKNEIVPKVPKIVLFLNCESKHKIIKYWKIDKVSGLAAGSNFNMIPRVNLCQIMSAARYVLDFFWSAPHITPTRESDDF